jgi:hypothetical protein
MPKVLGLTAQAGMGSGLRPSCTPESSATEGLNSYKTNNADQMTGVAGNLQNLS